MGRFLTELEVRELQDGRHQLLSPLIYESSTVGIIIVPTGFITNYASIPRLPIVYLLFGGLGKREATLHDWLYTGEHNTGTGLVVNRSTADKVLRGARYSCDIQIMQEYESISVKKILNNTWALISAWLWWFGVRLLGARHWE